MEKFLISCLIDISEQKNVQGKTTYKNIHARTLEEKEEVTFDKGQAVVQPIRLCQN